MFIQKSEMQENEFSDIGITTTRLTADVLDS